MPRFLFFLRKPSQKNKKRGISSTKGETQKAQEFLCLLRSVLCLLCTSPISWTKRLPRDFEGFHDLTCRRDNRIVLRTAGLERISRHFRQSCAKFFNLSAEHSRN